MIDIAQILETIDTLYNRQAERFFKTKGITENEFLDRPEEQAVIAEIAEYNRFLAGIEEKASK